MTDNGASAAWVWPSAAYADIVAALHKIGSDLGRFPQAMVQRRLERRARQLSPLTLEQYAKRVMGDSAEATWLARDLSRPQGLLFADTELHAALLQQLPDVLSQSARPQIWVPCNDGEGEEAYAVAMVTSQAMALREADSDFLIYGTDSDVASIQFAQAGHFSAAAAEYVPPALRSQNLIRSGAEWLVQPALRRHVIFLRHAQDAPPPFFDVDLIVCQSLLEELNPAIERAMLERLHSVLRPGGLLAAGAQKFLQAHADLFRPMKAAPGLLLRVERAARFSRKRRSETAVPMDSYRHTFAMSRQPGLIVAADGGILESNAAAQYQFAQQLKPRPKTASKPKLSDLMAPESSIVLAQQWSTLNPGGEVDFALNLVDGSAARLHLSRVDAASEPLIHVQLISNQADVRLRERLDRALVLVHTTLAALTEGVIVLDASGKVLEINTMAEQLTGWSRAEALQQPYARVFRLQTATGAMVMDVINPIDSALAGKPVGDDPEAYYLRHRDGRRFALRLRLRSAASAQSGVVLVFDDVSEMNLLTEELAYRATHDTLTGLLNRAEFEARARAMVANAKTSGATAVLCYIDIDQFKVINDTLGHGAGDELLHELAGELRSRVAADDAFARLGGDEFGVLLFGHDLQTARAVADSLIDTARRFRFAWQGHTYAVTITIGAALIDSNAADITHAMSMADAACFVAKDAGRDRVLFAGNDDEMASRHVQMSMVGKIGKSLDEDRFVLHYEDVVSIESPKQVVYRELLVRMREADGKLLLPASFIQAAERYFLMGALDRWVLRKAFRGIAQLPPDEIIYAVNLSGQSLGDPKLLDFVLAELDSSGVDPKRICFEITETAAVSRLTEAVRFIQRISLCGCRFALDDFGSGMASFNYLKNFTVHFLKIDGSFVRAMLASRADRGMVESINSIGHEMGLKTIAEHVETPAMMQPLRDMGVDWAQGRAIAWGKAFDTLMP